MPRMKSVFLYLIKSSSIRVFLLRWPRSPTRSNSAWWQTSVLQRQINESEIKYSFGFHWERACNNFLKIQSAQTGPKPSLHSPDVFSMVAIVTVSPFTSAISPPYLIYKQTWTQVLLGSTSSTSTSWAKSLSRNWTKLEKYGEFTNLSGKSLKLQASHKGWTWGTCPAQH